MRQHTETTWFLDCQNCLRNSSLYLHPSSVGLADLGFPRSLQLVAHTAYEKGKYMLVLQNNLQNNQFWLKFNSSLNVPKTTVC